MHLRLHTAQRPLFTALSGVFPKSSDGYCLKDLGTTPDRAVNSRRCGWQCAAAAAYTQALLTQLPTHARPPPVFRPSHLVKHRIRAHIQHLVSTGLLPAAHSTAKQVHLCTHTHRQSRSTQASHFADQRLATANTAALKRFDHCLLLTGLTV